MSFMSNSKPLLVNKPKKVISSRKVVFEAHKMTKDDSVE